VDHLRDFFLTITNKNVKSKDFKIFTLKDKFLEKETICDSSDWTDLKIQEEGLGVCEFDGFKDFMLIYSKEIGKPKIHVYDYKTEEVNEISVG